MLFLMTNVFKLLLLSSQSAETFLSKGEQPAQRVTPHSFQPLPRVSPSVSERLHQSPSSCWSSAPLPPLQGRGIGGGKKQARGGKIKGGMTIIP